jgi:P27 family predicted phage terminase small subunit
MLRGSRIHNKRDPKPAGDLKTPPAGFDETLKDIWRSAIRNAPPGLLKRIDASVLEVWCVAHRMYRRAVEEVEKSGMVTKSPTTGLAIENPYLWSINKQALIMLRAAEQLGFSPASRTRIRAGADAGDTLGDWKDIATG